MFKYKAKLITRTITFTDAKVMCINVCNCEVDIVTYTMPGRYTDDEILSVLKSRKESSVLKLIHIVSQSVRVATLCMPEEEFIRHAVTLKEEIKHC